MAFTFVVFKSDKKKTNLIDSVKKLDKNVPEKIIWKKHKPPWGLVVAPLRMLLYHFILVSTQS